jgi:hypothetical protein
MSGRMGCKLKEMTKLNKLRFQLHRYGRTHGGGDAKGKTINRDEMAYCIKNSW